MTTIACAPPIEALPPDARILVVGGYGTGNVGDEAMLGGLLHLLAPRGRLCVVSRAPLETTGLHGVRAIVPAAALAEVRRSDAVVIGGGGLFSSHMGALGRAIPAFGLAAAALGRPVYIHGVSIDRTTPRITRPLLVRIARRAAGVGVRDHASAALLREWGIEARVTPDLSEHLEAAAGDRAAARLVEAGLDPSLPAVGLCLTGIEPRDEEALVDAVPPLVAAFPETQFVFIPMSHHPRVARHNDVLLGRRLQAIAPRMAILEAMMPPGEMLAVFHALAAAVCMRFHSFVFAGRAGIGIVGVPYAEKCRTWLAERELAPVPLAAPALIAALGALLATPGREHLLVAR